MQYKMMTRDLIVYNNIKKDERVTLTLTHKSEEWKINLWDKLNSGKGDVESDIEIVGVRWKLNFVKNCMYTVQCNEYI